MRKLKRKENVLSASDVRTVVTAVLRDPWNYPAQDLVSVCACVRPFFWHLDWDTFQAEFFLAVRDPALHWGKRRFWLVSAEA